MGAAPEGPGDDGGGFDPALRQACDNAADFLHRPADQHRLRRIIRRLLFGGAGVLAWWRMAAIMATAHDERNVPMPAMSGAGLVVIEAQLVFGRLEAILDGPAPALDRHQGFLPVPAGHQWRKRPARHQRYCGGSAGLWSTGRTGSGCIRRPQDRPVPGRPIEHPLALGSGPGRQPMPGGGIECAGNLGRNPGNRRLGPPGVELAGGADAEHIALAGPARAISTALTL